MGPLVFVPRRADGDQAVHSAVLHKLTELGARIAPRFGKEVTHIVFLKKLFPSNQEQSQQDAALRDLYDRVLKAGSTAVVVSNLWVNASAEQGSWAKVADYVVERPPEPADARFYAISPPKAGNGGKRNGAVGRRKSAGAVPLPADALTLDLDDSLFSSSQQINDADGPFASIVQPGRHTVSLLGKRHAPYLQPPAKRVAISAGNASAANRVHAFPAAQKVPLAIDLVVQRAGTGGPAAITREDQDRGKAATSTAAKTPGSQPAKRRRSTKTPGSSAATTPRDPAAKGSPAANAGSRTAPPAARSTELLESLARLQGGCRLNLSPEKPSKQTPPGSAVREPHRDRGVTPGRGKDKVTPPAARHQSAPRIRPQDQGTVGASQPALPTLAQRLQSRTLQQQQQSLPGAADQGVGSSRGQVDPCAERARKSVAWAENLTPDASPVAGLQVARQPRPALAPALTNCLPVSLSPHQPNQPASHAHLEAHASAAVQAGVVSAPCTASKPAGQSIKEEIQRGSTTYLLGSQEAGIAGLRAMSEPPSSGPGHDRQSDTSTSSIQAVPQAGVGTDNTVSPRASKMTDRGGVAVKDISGVVPSPADKAAAAGKDASQPVLLQVPKLKLAPSSAQTAAAQQNATKPDTSCMFQFGAMKAASTMGTPTLARATGAQQHHQHQQQVVPGDPSSAAPPSPPSSHVGVPLSKRLAAIGAGAKNQAPGLGSRPGSTGASIPGNAGAGLKSTKHMAAQPGVQPAAHAPLQAATAGAPSAPSRHVQGHIQDSSATVIDLTVEAPEAVKQSKGLLDSVATQPANGGVLPTVPERQHKSYKQAKLTSLLSAPVLLPQSDAAAGKAGEQAKSIRDVQPTGGQQAVSSNDRHVQQESSPAIKCIAATSVDPAVSAALKDTVAKLGGARIYVEGQADMHITHLVIGAERRTIKCLLAIAAGAQLVSPSWVTSSRAAGSWLPEQGFEAAPRWSGTAALVRQRQAQQPPAPPPLCDRLVYVHCNADKPATAAKSADLRQGLQRLVMALGGKVAPARACNLAVLVAGASAPSSIPKDAQTVTDDWLLRVAETHIIPA